MTETAMNGYNGRFLRVNLTDGTHVVETPDPSFYRRYAGGRNFGAYHLLTEVPKGADPLGPENKLIFAVSMLTGLALSGQGRSSAIAKSPLTGGWGESEAGGHWPGEFKAAGYDALILEGVCPEPSYLWIHDGEVELRPAGEIWGLPTKEAQDALLSAVGEPKARVAQIGIAGENLVRYACIVNDLSHVYGRSGLGAVMGAKRLRAVVVRGSAEPTIADPATIKELADSYRKGFDTHPALPLHRRLGTTKGVLPLNEAGLFPTRNFHCGDFEHAADISGERMDETIADGRHGCRGCIIGCKRRVSYDGPEFSIDPAYGGPEYETIGAFGSGCLVSDIKVVAKANELCNRYGLDTISCALTIACAMECFENGLLTESDTDGLALRFGNGDAMLACVEKAAHRAGFGERLAEGSKRFAAALGGGANKFAMQVKGQELPSHEPRGKWGVALGYAVSPTGADHLNAAHDPWFEVDADPATAWISLNDVRPLGLVEPVPALSLGPEKVRQFTALQDVWSMINVIDFCLFCSVPEFSTYQLEELVRAVGAVTGWNTSLAELLTWGARGITMARAFNAREGFGRVDDTLPDRLFEPLESGAFKGKAIPREELDKAIGLYYGMRGWDENGCPTPATLHRLDLGWLADVLEEANA